MTNRNRIVFYLTGILAVLFVAWLILVADRGGNVMLASIIFGTYLGGFLSILVFARCPWPPRLCIALLWPAIAAIFSIVEIIDSVSRYYERNP